MKLKLEYSVENLKNYGNKAKDNQSLVRWFSCHWEIFKLKLIRMILPLGNMQKLNETLLNKQLQTVKFITLW